jgi:hypothetical protein
VCAATSFGAAVIIAAGASASSPDKTQTVALHLAVNRMPTPEAKSAAPVKPTLCSVIESAAHENKIPVWFFTRILWVESRFHPEVTSVAGAQGIAQFMPETAASNGLADPFDPQQAIAHSAQLLAALDKQFGNLGLAAAAYNAGAMRVTRWLQHAGDLPGETRAYVQAVTDRAPEEWAADARGDDAVLAAEPTVSPCIGLPPPGTAAAQPAPPPPQVRTVVVSRTAATVKAMPAFPPATSAAQPVRPGFRPAPDWQVPGGPAPTRRVTVTVRPVSDWQVSMDLSRASTLMMLFSVHSEQLPRPHRLSDPDALCEASLAVDISCASDRR